MSGSGVTDATEVPTMESLPTIGVYPRMHLMPSVGMRNSARVDAVCRNLGLETLFSTPSLRRAGYIYRRRPRRWPLSVGESISLVARFAAATARGSRFPRPLETVEQWGARVLGPRATQWLVGPALHGRYAGDPARLSASLLFGRPEWPAPRVRKGVVTPVGGMQQLIDALERRLRTREVSIRLNTVPTLDGSTPVVICTSARAAAECLRDVAPAASQALSTIDMLPLVRITAFYPGEATSQWGRGILFPRGGGDIRALGVLFNTNIFPQRKGEYSESWIYGGATDRDVVELSDVELGADDGSRPSVALRSRRQAGQPLRAPLVRSPAVPRPAARVGARAGLRPAEGGLPRGELRGGHRPADGARAGRCGCDSVREMA